MSLVLNLAIAFVALVIFATFGVSLLAQMVATTFGQLGAVLS